MLEYVALSVWKKKSFPVVGKLDGPINKLKLG